MSSFSLEELEAMRLANEQKKEQEALERAAERQLKKRNKPPTYSYENTKVKKSEMATLISAARKWAKNPPCKDDTEVMCRIEKFWDTCEETGEIPTWTNLAMCLGVNSMTINEWERGTHCSKERSRMIQEQRDMFRTIQDTLALTGKTAPVPYIWQSKQHLGYREPSTKIEIEQVSPLEELPTLETVEQKYFDIIPVDVIEEVKSKK